MPGKSRQESLRSRLGQGLPCRAARRAVARNDGSVRQMRVFAEPALSPAGTIEAVAGVGCDVIRGQPDVRGIPFSASRRG